MNSGQVNFIGRYYHALEQKGRLSIPKLFREKMAGSAVLTHGLDGCLFIFPLSGWTTVIESAGNLPFTRKNARDWVRLLANNAVEVTFDRLGRILIPDHLQAVAALDKDVVIVGSLNRLEIWDRQRYHAYFDNISKEAESIAERIGDTKEADA